MCEGRRGWERCQLGGDEPSAGIYFPKICQGAFIVLLLLGHAYYVFK